MQTDQKVTQLTKFAQDNLKKILSQQQQFKSEFTIEGLKIEVKLTNAD